MSWLEAASHFKTSSTPFVIVTITNVRGHAPRGLGSKMLVTADEIVGSIGGGNLEQTAIKQARTKLNKQNSSPENMTLQLNPKGGDYGVQCCGGEVKLLLEPMVNSKSSVTIFGAGHVGWALVHILSLFPIDIYLIDSRKEQLKLPDKVHLNSTANLQKSHFPIPETAFEMLPDNTHTLVMTHDHAEDLAILDMALRKQNHSFLGLIGSSTKWTHFQEKLKTQGHTQNDLERITTPIGLAQVQGKSPQAIALAISAQLLTYLNFEEGDF